MRHHRSRADLEIERIERSERRKDRVAGVVMSALPGILAKLLGEGTPAGAAPGQPALIAPQNNDTKK